MNVNMGSIVSDIRCALMCVSCDILAGRKIWGFLGHSAHLGSSKCLKEFSGTVGSMDYSGFDRHSWKLRRAKS